jgi:hypothetical protein
MKILQIMKMLFSLCCIFLCTSSAFNSQSLPRNQMHAKRSSKKNLKEGNQDQVLGKITETNTE